MMSQRRATKRKVLVLTVTAIVVLTMIRFADSFGVVKHMALPTLIIWCGVAFFVFVGILVTIALHVERLMRTTGETVRNSLHGNE